MSYTPTEWDVGDVITAAKLNKLEQGVAEGGGISYDAVFKLDAENLNGATSATLMIGTYSDMVTKAMAKEPLNVLVYGHSTNSQYMDTNPYTRTFGIVDVWYDNYAYQVSDQYIEIIAMDFNQNNQQLALLQIKLYSTGTITLGTLRKIATTT